MRARVRLVAAVLALPLLTGLTACGSAGSEAPATETTAQETTDEFQEAVADLNAATACFDAVSTATGFAPSFENPEQAKREAETKIQELDDLIAKTSDPDTKSALEEVRASVEQVASGEITAETELEWLGEHMNKVEKVSDACLEEQ